MTTLFNYAELHYITCYKCFHCLLLINDSDLPKNDFLLAPLKEAAHLFPEQHQVLFNQYNLFCCNLFPHYYKSHPHMF